jgi:precorrin-2/cobalt-factor-2 C20-methyltransferase
MYPVVFVSLGPGEAELMTIKGLKALQNADLIFYPSTRKVGLEISRSFEILFQLHIPVDKLLPFRVLMSKDRTAVLKAYQDVASQLTYHHIAGRKVAIVVEGDSGFYSSTYYIYELLNQQGVPSERIAGIPAFVAAGTLAMLHIAKLDEEMHVVPGSITADDLQRRIQNNNVVVIMKTSICQDEVKACILHFPEASYHYFENVGVPQKEFYTSDNAKILARKFPYFSLMIIKK